ncbi:uncharacterized protein CTHT_0059950 [Thermochaetoides thermophila DSM 1495]|uniref:Uncharacterized protein n=1 Tax=Chaetomium thermophilum (strain DSM 1495 / CBS 144.50 / IMI 039719) TaxID=759272 RepID=G0SEW6_CHATD|nr:hypothetical protein CTHT_0059950 [Thermochaetoides thermophila DSM 1495]EGS17982.1 hypothetical protein CTHT_0059950 [Thermochaetoides thermophila DSM 1495]
MGSKPRAKATPRVSNPKVLLRIQIAVDTALGAKAPGPWVANYRAIDLFRQKAFSKPDVASSNPHVTLHYNVSLTAATDVRNPHPLQNLVFSPLSKKSTDVGTAVLSNSPPPRHGVSLPPNSWHVLARRRASPDSGQGEGG